MAEEIKWACPKCGAKVEKHGEGGQSKCKSRRPEANYCNGFLCECEGNEDSDNADHGVVFTNVCTDARCHHCGWAGSFPQKPKGLEVWEKKALDAGWSMPAKRKKELKL